MTIERFTQLMNEGPLHHPEHHSQIARLLNALQYVVEGCGKKGGDMLEAFCETLKEKDRETFGIQYADSETGKEKT